MITEVNAYLADEDKVLVTFLMDKELLKKMEDDAAQATKFLGSGVLVNFTSLAQLISGLSEEIKNETVESYLKLLGVKEPT